MCFAENLGLGFSDPQDLLKGFGLNKRISICKLFIYSFNMLLIKIFQFGVVSSVGHLFWLHVTNKTFFVIIMSVPKESVLNIRSST